MAGEHATRAAKLRHAGGAAGMVDQMGRLFERTGGARAARSSAGATAGRRNDEWRKSSPFIVGIKIKRGACRRCSAASLGRFIPVMRRGLRRRGGARPLATSPPPCAWFSMSRAPRCGRSPTACRNRESTVAGEGCVDAATPTVRERGQGCQNRKPKSVALIKRPTR